MKKNEERVADSEKWKSNRKRIVLWAAVIWVIFIIVDVVLSMQHYPGDGINAITEGIRVVIMGTMVTCLCAFAYAIKQSYNKVE